MNYAEQQRSPTKHIIGITVVVLLHVVLIWALMNGLGAKIVQELHPPIQTKIITQKKPPPYIPTPKIQIKPPPQQE
ncbi:MAG: energy transducer TonB, partial [Gluconacetobacter liquefaciens]